VERLVTHVGIINRGSLKFQGLLASLVERQEASSRLVLHSSDNALALRVFLEDGLDASIENGKVVVEGVSAVQTGHLNRKLVALGIAVFELTPAGRDLERKFFKLIEE
jgi:ABC-2 type transport system ATP-binding protein